MCSTLTSSSISNGSRRKNTYFKIIHQNIRSMRKNFDFFVLHIASMESIPDIIFLTEIWIYEEEKSHYSIPGYNFYAYCNETMVSGGVGVFVKNEINHSFKLLDMETADCIKLNVCVNKINFTFLCIYRLHEFSVANFLEQLKVILDKSKSKNFIILGDLNIDLLEKSNVVSDFISTMSSAGLKSGHKTITRLVSGKCLDHVFYRFNCNLYISKVVYVENHHISDHGMILINLGIESYRKVNNVISLQENINVNEIVKYLQSVNWDCITKAQNCNDALIVFFVLF